MDTDWDFLDELKESKSPKEFKNISMATEFKEIPGFSILQDAVTEIDEQKIIKKIEQGTWAKAPGSREVQQYGRLYDYKTRSLGEQTAMPKWLLVLAEILDLPRPENVIINKYEPGEGIAQHTDNVCFGPVVASLSLMSPITMDLKFNALEHSIRLEPRSLLKLTGESRTRWTHGIASRKNDTVDMQLIPRKKRISITFRTLN